LPGICTTKIVEASLTFPDNFSQIPL